MTLTIIGASLLVAGIATFITGIIHAMGGKDEQEGSKQFEHRASTAMLAIISGSVIGLIGFVICVRQLIKFALS